MDRTIGPKGEERRDVSAQLYYAHKLNRIFAVAIVVMAASLLTMSAVFYQFSDYLGQRDRDRQVNKYLNCVQLFASGLDEPECEVYKEYILKNQFTPKRKP